MRRPRVQRRSATVNISADGGLVEVRANDKVLGEIVRLGNEADAVMSGAFSHRPAFADYARLFLQLTRAIAAGNAGEESDLRSRLEEQGVEVWHTSHDMRIDRPQTLVVGEGRARFAPNDAFMMMRTGGL